VEPEHSTLPEHLCTAPVFGGVRVARSLVFYEVFCRSLFVLLSFFFWPLRCLSFFDLWILITPPLVSSIFSQCTLYSFDDYEFMFSLQKHIPRYMKDTAIFWSTCT